MAKNDQKKKQDERLVITYDFVNFNKLRNPSMPYEIKSIEKPECGEYLYHILYNNCHPFVIKFVDKLSFDMLDLYNIQLVTEYRTLNRIGDHIEESVMDSDYEEGKSHAIIDWGFENLYGDKLVSVMNTASETPHWFGVWDPDYRINKKDRQFVKEKISDKTKIRDAYLICLPSEKYNQIDIPQSNITIRTFCDKVLNGADPDDLGKFENSSTRELLIWICSYLYDIDYDIINEKRGK